MGNNRLSRAGTIGLYGSIAAAVLFLIFMAGWIGMNLGAASDDDTESAAQTRQSQPATESVAPEPTVSLSLPTKATREPAKTPEPAETHKEAVEVPDRITRPPEPEQERSPAILAPPAPPVRPAPEEALEPEPEFACPAGTMLVSLDRVDVGKAYANKGQYEDSFQERDVHIVGSVTNGAEAPVLVDITSASMVHAINSRGETLSTYFPEFDYIPPPGKMMPLEVTVQPGESLTFSVEEPAVTERQWSAVTHFVMETSGWFPTFEDHLETDMLSCEDPPVLYGTTSAEINLD